MYFQMHIYHLRMYYMSIHLEGPYPVEQKARAFQWLEPFHQGSVGSLDRWQAAWQEVYHTQSWRTFLYCFLER